MDRVWSMAIKILSLQEKLGRSVTASEILDAIRKYEVLDTETMYYERNLMSLIDLGIIGTDWENIDGKWYRTYYICDDCINLVRKIRDKDLRV